MSTRSRIAIENQDGTVKSIYCHFDGYLSGVGRLLKEYYTTQAKVEALIELGDISALEMTPGSTVAYARDRGEDLNFKEFSSVPELFVHGYDSGEEFIYCFTKDNIFLVNERGSNQINDLKVAFEEEGA
jgi:hypothetical protein